MALMAGILILGVVILVHELGHILMATWARIKAKRLSVGIGPVLLRRKRGETEYCLSALPFGGYAILDAEGDTPGIASRTRLLLSLAGPLANVLLAALLLGAVLFAAWLEASHPGTLPSVWGPAETVIPATISQVEPGSPADTAGLRPGDRITACDGTPVRALKTLIPCIRFSLWRTVPLTIERVGHRWTLELVPRPTERGTQKPGRTGIAVALPVVNPFTDLPRERKQAAPPLLSGPLVLIWMAGQAVTDGVEEVLLTTAAVSLSVGLFNLLPIPPLDGGSIMLTLIEVVCGRPLSERMQDRIIWIGIYVLGALMVFAFFNDVLWLMNDQ